MADFSQGDEVEDEEEGAKDRPLGDPAGYYMWFGCGVTKGDIFCLVCEVWLEPRTVSVSPMVRWSRFSRMSRPTVSNASHRSRRMRREERTGIRCHQKVICDSDEGLFCAVGITETEWKFF